MFIADKLIDEITVDFELITTLNYLQEKRQLLENKHQSLIARSIFKPVFYVGHIPSKMHASKIKKGE
jgi:hypothetical protein